MYVVEYPRLGILRKKGIPTITVVTTEFQKFARLNAYTYGVSELPLVVIPRAADLPDDDIRDLAREAYPHILAGLTRKGQQSLDYYVNYSSPSHRTNLKCEVCEQEVFHHDGTSRKE